MEEIRVQTRIKEEIDKLMVLAEGYIESQVGVHTIERGLFKQLLNIGLALLIFILKAKIERLSRFGAPQSGGKPMRGKGVESRQYLSLFGLLHLERPSYWDKDLGKIHPVDGQLMLPKSSYWSYNIEELVGESSSENDFKESVRLLNALLNLGLSGKSSERNAGHLGPVVELFYGSKAIEQELEAVCFSASFDGKGVPKIKQKSEQLIEGNPKKRLGKGEKRGIMEMATVSVTSSFTPRKRNIDSIVKGLMGSIAKSEKAGPESEVPRDNNWHKNIHRRAFLADQQKSIEYGLNRIKASMVNPHSRFVVPIDAGIGLEDKVLAWVKENEMEGQFDGILLDIIHVSEYVWDAATAIFGEKSRCRAAWVQEMLTDLLHSKVEKVIEDLQQINAKTELSETKQKQVAKAITYFTNHKHKMDYKTFLEKGYPISSALVEAACGHLVKERMEQSGMRWSSTGAQNIMDLRAVKTNGDMKDFMAFRIQTEQQTTPNKAA